MKNWLRTLTTLALAGGMVQAAELEVGQPIPAISVKDHKGEVVELSEATKEGYALVYFYPKADTPGCTKQACSLRDAYEELTDKKVKVFGVSTDTVEEQKAFAEKFKLPFTLLADKKAEVAKAFGVPLMREDAFAKRQAFLFKDGKLVWRDLKASTAKQAEDVLAVLAKG